MARVFLKRDYGAVFVSRVEHIGDLVALEPVVDAVLARHPGARVGWIVRREFRELLAGNPSLDSIIAVTCLTEAKLLAKVIRRWAPLYDLHESGRSCHLLGLRFVRQEIEVSCDNYYDAGSLLEAFSRCGSLPVVRQQPKLALHDVPLDKIRPSGRPYVVLHCRSSSPSRDWPREKWALFAQRLSQLAAVELVEIGLDPIFTAQDLVRPLAGRLTLGETAALIRGAALFVGIDSGPAHMANALGIPGVILTGPWLKWNWYQPFSGSYAGTDGIVRLHDDASVARIEVEAVVEGAINLLHRTGVSLFAGGPGFA